MRNDWNGEQDLVEVRFKGVSFLNDRCSERNRIFDIDHVAVGSYVICLEVRGVIY